MFEIKVETEFVRKMLC